jgi:hypothetical protein
MNKMMKRFGEWGNDNPIICWQELKPRFVTGWRCMHTTKCQATDKRSCIYKKSTMRQIIIFLVEIKFVSVFRFLLFLLPHPFFFFNRLPCILLYVNWHATGKEKKIKSKFLQQNIRMFFQKDIDCLKIGGN